MHKPVNSHPHITHTTNSTMLDIIISHALLDHLKKKEQVKDEGKDKDKGLKKKEVYQSPKRDNLCVQCGQQLHWCVCYLND